MKHNQKAPLTISIVSSHKAQVPGGEVQMSLKETERAPDRIHWSVSPDSGPITGGDTGNIRWSAPADGSAIYKFSALARIGEADDLTVIKGIGDKVAYELLRHGIDVFDAFRSFSEPELKMILGSSGVGTDVGSIMAQAAELAAKTPEKTAARATEVVEVTPNALPLHVVDRIEEGKQALERSADALTSGIAGGVKLQRQFPPTSPHKAIWAMIRNRTDALSFSKYKPFMDAVMCGDVPDHAPRSLRDQVDGLRFRGTDGYQILRQATEAFLMHEAGTLPENIVFDEADERRRLPQLAKSGESMADNRNDYLEKLEDESKTFPYFKVIREKLKDIPLKTPGVSDPTCYGILKTRINQPLFIELIWSYWMEEGMLVQTMKALSLRFQNRAVKGQGSRKNPLSNFNIDPLRPMANLLWGYVQDEQHRLTLTRRAYEYDHHYGFTIKGDGVRPLDPADSRKGFLEAFHTLLHRCSIYYREQSDTTKVPDGYPILNGLKECHILLAQGAHNQYGDLPWTARIEMLLEQWLLSRPETRDFLGRRAMVPYPEEWMASVDQARDLMGWHGASIRHFRDLAIFGEQILLSIRFGNWSDEFDENVSALWAQQAREAVLAYLNAYRAATSVDLSADGDKANAELSRKRLATPSVLLAQRSNAMTAAE